MNDELLRYFDDAIARLDEATKEPQPSPNQQPRPSRSDDDDWSLPELPGPPTRSTEPPSELVDRLVEIVSVPSSSPSPESDPTILDRLELPSIATEVETDLEPHDLPELDLDLRVSGADAEPVIAVRRERVIDAPSSALPGPVEPLVARLNVLRVRPTDRPAVAAARVGLAALLLVALVAIGGGLLAVPVVGSAFPKTPVAVLDGDPLLWRYGLVVPPPRTPAVPLLERGYLKASVIDDLRAMYAAFLAAYDAAIETGDASPLRPLFSDQLYQRYETIIAAMHHDGWKHRFFGDLVDPANLSFRIGDPPESPTFVLASVFGYVEDYLYRGSGPFADDAIVKNTIFLGIDVTFLKRTDGTWRIDSITFGPSS